MLTNKPSVRTERSIHSSETKMATKPKQPPHKRETEDVKNKGNKRGLDDIDQIFDQKKPKLNADKNRAAQKRDKPRTGGSNKQPLAGSSRVGQDQPLPLGWVDDGLGGKYNSEGFTGRVEDGVKIFKAHVLNKPEAGKSNKCPFDCDCCFI
ncbi:hypothetical protein ACA910_022490 [Epithemia clementina (nom. ined.)]